MIDAETLSERLPPLLLDVAQQVDRSLGGRDLNAAVFHTLSQTIKETIGVEEPDSRAFYYADPITTEVFAQAVSETSNQAVSSVTELVAALKEITSSINADVNTWSAADLSKIKLFCLSLYRSLISQKLPPRHEGESAFDDQLGFVR